MPPQSLGIKTQTVLVLTSTALYLRHWYSEINIIRQSTVKLIPSPLALDISRSTSCQAVQSTAIQTVHFRHTVPSNHRYTVKEKGLKNAKNAKT